MRIALITDAWLPQVNGVVTTLGHVQRELEALGHEFLVIHPHVSGLRTFPTPRYPEIRLALRPRPTVRRLLDEFQPHAVHVATEGPLGLAGRSECRRRGWPFTTSYHTQFAQYLHAYARVPVGLTYKAVRWFHSAAVRTLVPTPSINRELAKRGFRNLMTWTRGVDTTLFKMRSSAEHTLGHLPRPIFIFTGRVAVEKNIGAFLQLDLPGSKVVIGDGPAMGAMKARFPSAHFLGYKRGEELARTMASADVFVFPSRTDTFGIVMLEAMACGLPVAACPVTGPIDVVRDGVTGVLNEDLRSACIRCLDLRRDDCRAQALEFTWKRCASLFAESLAPIGAQSLRISAPRAIPAALPLSGE